MVLFGKRALSAIEYICGSTAAGEFLEFCRTQSKAVSASSIFGSRPIPTLVVGTHLLGLDKGYEPF